MEASPPTLESVRAELARVTAEIAVRRRHPLWFVFPSVWALRTQRNSLRVQEAKLKQDAKAAKKPRAPKPPPTNVPHVTGAAVQDADLIITAAEINERHGTGVLLQRIFRTSPGFIHVRSIDIYGGETSGALQVRAPACTSDELIAMLQGSTVKRILSVPYSNSDVRNTLALHAATGAPLCVWLMDHNLGNGEHQIASDLMKELLDRAQLRLGISPEFCTLYRDLFGHEIHFAPPIVDASLAQRTPLHLGEGASLAGVLLGNVWSQRWLEKLADAVAEAQVSMVAYGPKSPQWVKNDALAAQVETRGFLPEDELVTALRSHPFAVVPTGTLDTDDDLPEVARYSLPSRTLYLSAVGNLPVIVIGHEDSGVARFVKRHGLGIVVPYDGKEFRRAVRSICEPEQQAKYRRRAAQMAPAFACDDMLDWLWRSLEAGGPADERWSDSVLGQG